MIFRWSVTSSQIAKIKLNIMQKRALGVNTIIKSCLDPALLGKQSIFTPTLLFVAVLSRRRQLL